MAQVLPKFLNGNAGAAIQTAFTFVKQNARGDVIPVSAATDIPVAVATEAVASGRPVSLYHIGTSAKIKVKASNTAIAANAAVGTNNSGRLVAKTTNGDYAIGYAVGAIEANEIGMVVVAPHEV